MLIGGIIGFLLCFIFLVLPLGIGMYRIHKVFDYYRRGYSLADVTFKYLGDVRTIRGFIQPHYMNSLESLSDKTFDFYYNGVKYVILNRDVVAVKVYAIDFASILWG